jgi:hypothetical protein
VLRKCPGAQVSTRWPFARLRLAARGLRPLAWLAQGTRDGCTLLDAHARTTETPCDSASSASGPGSITSRRRRPPSSRSSSRRGATPRCGCPRRSAAIRSRSSATSPPRPRSSCSRRASRTSTRATPFRCARSARRSAKPPPGVCCSGSGCRTRRWSRGCAITPTASPSPRCAATSRR